MTDVINPDRNGTENNGLKSDDDLQGKVDPLNPRSPGESLWHPEAGDDLNGSRSQRRHYNNFNKSTVFDFIKQDEENGQEEKPEIPKTPPTLIQQQLSPNAQEEALERKQKRHFNARNRSSFDL